MSGLDPGDLTWHLGGVWNFWGRVVAEGVTSVDVLQTWEQTPRPSDTFLRRLGDGGAHVVVLGVGRGTATPGGVDLDRRQP